MGGPAGPHGRSGRGSPGARNWCLPFASRPPIVSGSQDQGERARGPVLTFPDAIRMPEGKKALDTLERLC